jgi:hypothetical protein
MSGWTSLSCRIPGRGLVIVQGVTREGDRGRQAISLVLNLLPLLPDRPHAMVPGERGTFSATPPNSWYTRGALPI